MKEILHIYSEGGKPISEVDLGAAGSSLTVVESDAGKLVLSGSAASDDKVFAALLRDDDGWILATADESRPVRSGNKAANDARLTAGIPCRIGGFVFQLERDADETGYVLLWRRAGSPVSADVIMAGRNVMVRGRHGGDPEVNPPVIENVMFEFFQTEAGLEISMPGNSSDRLEVPPCHLFTVGEIEGMMMSSSSAAKAIVRANPFAWPSRGIRLRLLAATLALGALFAVAAGFALDANRYRRLNELPHGAVETPPANGGRPEAVDDDIVVYTLSFFRSLPLVLTPTPNEVTVDLIDRGRLLASDTNVARKVAFLRDVESIQNAIRTGRWDALRDTLAALDAGTFQECDADKFLSDARTVASVVTEKLPQRLAEGSALGHRQEFARCREDAERILARLTGNVFMTEQMLRREKDTLAGCFSVLGDYIDVRDRVFEGLNATAPALSGGDLRRVCESYREMSVTMPEDDPKFSALMKRERRVLDSLVRRCASFVLSREESDASGTVAAMLGPLADLAEIGGTDAATLADWRKRAKAASRKVEAYHRRLYAEYRLKSGTDREDAEKALAELLKIGDPSNSYYKWALKEKSRLGGKGK